MFPGSLVTKRLLVKKGTLPSYAKMIVGEVASRTNIVEESIIDPISRVSFGDGSLMIRSVVINILYCAS